MYLPNGAEMAEGDSGLGRDSGRGDTVTSKHVNTILKGGHLLDYANLPLPHPWKEQKKEKKKSLRAKLFLQAFLSGLKYFKSLDTRLT